MNNVKKFGPNRLVIQLPPQAEEWVAKMAAEEALSCAAIVRRTVFQAYKQATQGQRPAVA